MEKCCPCFMKSNSNQASFYDDLDDLEFETLLAGTVPPSQRFVRHQVDDDWVPFWNRMAALFRFKKQPIRLEDDQDRSDGYISQQRTAYQPFLSHQPAPFLRLDSSGQRRQQQLDTQEELLGDLGEDVEILSQEEITRMTSRKTRKDQPKRIQHPIIEQNSLVEKESSRSDVLVKPTQKNVSFLAQQDTPSTSVLDFDPLNPLIDISTVSDLPPEHDQQSTELIDTQTLNGP